MVSIYGGSQIGYRLLDFPGCYLLKVCILHVFDAGNKPMGKKPTKTLKVLEKTINHNDKINIDSFDKPPLSIFYFAFYI